MQFEYYILMFDIGHCAFSSWVLRCDSEEDRGKGEGGRGGRLSITSSLEFRRSHGEIIHRNDLVADRNSLTIGMSEFSRSRLVCRFALLFMLSPRCLKRKIVASILARDCFENGYRSLWPTVGIHMLHGAGLNVCRYRLSVSIS